VSLSENKERRVFQIPIHLNLLRIQNPDRRGLAIIKTMTHEL